MRPKSNSLPSSPTIVHTYILDSQTSIFYVDGPLPVQCIALSDSSEESISSKVERQAQVELYQSSSQMLHNRQLSGYQASSSLPNSSPSSPIPTPGSVSGLYTKEDSPEVMDWVDYSDPRAAMSEYGTTGVSISEADQGVDDLIPFVIHNEIKGKETVLLDLETVVSCHPREFCLQLTFFQRELVRSRLRPVAAPFAPKKPSRQAHRPPQVVSPELPGSEAYHLPSSPTSVILEQKAIRLGLALPTKEVSSLAQETQPTLEQPNSQHMSCDGCGRKVAIKGWFKALPCEVSCGHRHPATELTNIEAHHLLVMLQLGTVKRLRLGRLYSMSKLHCRDQHLPPSINGRSTHHPAISLGSSSN